MIIRIYLAIKPMLSNFDYIYIMLAFSPLFILSYRNTFFIILL